MKRKFLSLILAGVLLVSGTLTGCSSASGSESEAKEKKVLKVGMECAYAPFNWTQSSKKLSNGDEAVPIYGTKDYAYGYDVMLAKKLADKMGYELEVHKVDWSSIVLGMNSGDYDVIIAGMGYTEERDLSVDFTDPYYIRNNVLVVKKDGKYKNATKLSDFKGASSTTQLGTIWEQYVPQIPDVKKLTFFETTSEVVMAVATGSADCAILDEPTAMSAVIANPDLKYINLDAKDPFAIPKGQSLNVCIAVKEGDKSLKTKLDKALDDIGWNEDKMTELMNLSVELQPLSK
jgi:putative lysine transport system substrate-binding protein